QLMKPIPDLDDLLARANNRHIFGTKMRSNILSANEEGIKAVIEQQFEIGKQIIAAGLVPIIEPEVNIHAEDKKEIEEIMTRDILKQLNTLAEDELAILNLTIPTVPTQFKALVEHTNVIRVIAPSRGYTSDEAVALLKENAGTIASFSSALSSALRA